MKFASEFRDPALVRTITLNLRKACRGRWKLMEFCGTHTVAIFRYGLRSLLPENLILVSGPGCPVCVTPKAELDRAIYLSGLDSSVIATYGDLVKVPGSEMSLAEKRARGADVRVVYSSYDAVALAERLPDKRVFFVAIGFETTAPSTAAAVLRAKALGLRNFFVLSLHKRTPPVLEALLKRGTSVEGFVCPGHVSAIIGAAPFEPVASHWRRPCVVSGFEPSDVLQALLMLVRQLEDGRSQVEVEYARGVPYHGNRNALKLMDQVFTVTASEWRGLGEVEASGLRLREAFSPFDASAFIDRDIVSLPDPPGCRCGDVLRGDISPSECALFRKNCTPENPVGPCMVSSEGSCATHYLYGDR